MKSSAYMYGELRKIITDITVKYKNKGDESDDKTIEGLREVDEYILAMEKSDKFQTTRKYTAEAVIRSGLTTDKRLAEIYAKEPASIPEEWQDRVHQAQREVIIENYVEKNEYYRMLSGVPPLELDELNYAYASENFYEKYNLDFKPVHELETYYCDLLMNDPVEWDLLIEMYDAVNVRWYEYLYHMGSKRIDPYIARQALNFQILHMNTNDVDTKILEDFSKYYEQNREYTMTVLYNVPYSLRYPYYDEYMAFMVIVMTIQRVIVNQFKNGIEREFYDLATLKTLMDCYNIPFIERLPIDRQRMIAKNLNKLLYYKSSDKVIYDISAILGFDKLTVYKYLLVKQHRYDSDGNPIFVYKAPAPPNPNGRGAFADDPTEPPEFDYEAMYDVYFQSIELSEKNVPEAVHDLSKRVDYQFVTDGDPHWWGDDPELLDHLYKDDYNYIDTKYLHMNVMYKLTEMLFESTTFIRMILENENQTSTVEIDMPKLSLNTQVSIYDAILSLATLICHRHGMKGEFIYGPTKIFAILGFNFAEELQILRQNIRDTGIPDFNVIDGYIRDMNVGSLNDINRVLGNIEAMREYITMRTREAKTIEEYRTYRKIYRMLLLSEENEELYKKKDDTNAVTVKELLQDRRPDLYELIMGLDPVEDSEKITELSEHIIYRLQDEIENLNNLFYVSTDSNTMVDALRKLIMFFKSYTVDLKDFNILYMVDSRFHNRILLMDELRSMNIETWINDNSISGRYIDILLANIDIRILDNLTMRERLDYLTHIFLIDKITMRDMIKKVDIEALIKDESSLGRYIDELTADMDVKIYDELKMEERLQKLYSVLLVMYIKTVHQINRVQIDVDKREYTKTLDIIANSLSYISLNDRLNYEELIDYFVKVNLRTDIKMRDTYKILNELIEIDRIYSMDIIDAVDIMVSKRDKITVRDEFNKTSLTMFETRIHTTDKLCKDTNAKLNDNMFVLDNPSTVDVSLPYRSEVTVIDANHFSVVSKLAKTMVSPADKIKSKDMSVSHSVYQPVIDTLSLDTSVSAPREIMDTTHEASKVLTEKLCNTRIKVVEKVAVGSGASLVHKEKQKMRHTLRRVYS